MKRVLITGGAGFIGSYFTEQAARKGWQVVVLDKLTYAGKIENLSTCINAENVQFVQGDICKYPLVKGLFDEYRFDTVVNFAAETHVDNSIENATEFVRTNVTGVHTLLDAAKKTWEKDSASLRNNRFLQISTDEVYGETLEPVDETAPLRPSSPYAATKASADLLCLSYHRTYGMPVVITRSCNNYGLRQHPEKLIPKVVQLCKEKKPIPVYGDGQQRRCWLHVEDHCGYLLQVLAIAQPGEVYNLIGDIELSNLELVQKIVGGMGVSQEMIRFVPDRLGHDFCYRMKSLRGLMEYVGRSLEDGIVEMVRGRR